MIARAQPPGRQMLLNVENRLQRQPHAPKDGEIQANTARERRTALAVQKCGKNSFVGGFLVCGALRFERALGAEHPRVAETLTNLAQLYTSQGYYHQADPLLERAQAIAEQALGPAHPQIATILDAQGQLALLQGRQEQAERLLQRALTLQEQALGTSHPEVARTLHHLAKLSEKQGKDEQAELLYQRALAICKQAIGMQHPETISLGKDYQELLQRMQERGTVPGKRQAMPPGP